MHILLWIGVAGLLFSYGGWKYVHKEQELQELKQLSTELLHINDEMKRTLAFGLYHRFKADMELGGADTLSELYARNNPYEFEYFVADILEGLHGGTTYVSSGSNLRGFDIEHKRQSGSYLICAQCNQENVSYEDVAILHSQVVKHKAKAGYIIATGDFTEQAKHYALETGIRLIDGIGLVSMWEQHLSKMSESLRRLASDQPLNWKPAHS